MKQFEFVQSGGSRLTIYPAGTQAKRETGAYVDAPYIDIQNRFKHMDVAELVRNGHVQKRVSVLTWNHPEDGSVRCRNLQEIIDLMKEL